PPVFRGRAFLVGNAPRSRNTGIPACAPSGLLAGCVWAHGKQAGMPVWRTDLEVCVPSAVERSYFNSNEPQSTAIILVMPLTSSWRTFVPLLKKTITLLL